MAPDDDEWIHDEAGDERPDDEALDEEWPPGPGGVPGLPAGGGKPWGHGGAPGFSGWIAAVVAVAAAVAGVAVGLYLVRATPAASPASGVGRVGGVGGMGGVGGATPSASAPGLPGLPGLSGLSGNGNGQLQVMLTGQVLAVSRTSITIGGAGPAVTAAVTSATTITGSVHGVGGVKVGDEISAQITGTPSHLTATALQDPAGHSGPS